MNSFHSYPKIYNIGHKAIQDLLTKTVIVEEKIDGSQFSFGASFGINEEVELHMRSKGCTVYDGAPSMFDKAIKTVNELLPILHDGWTYRCEYLSKPKHNSLAYNRVPNKNLILFDVNTGEEEYLNRERKEEEAKRLGLECVPELWFGILTHDVFDKLLDTVSILGGQKIEGIVIKQYVTKMFGSDGKALMGKHVSEKFKEVHAGEWKMGNPSKLEAIDSIGQSLRTPARWDKAVQHLLDGGKLDNSPKDIGELMKLVPLDVLEECKEDIMEKLFDYAWPKIRRILTAGLPEWYKSKLIDEQFKEKDCLCSNINV